MALMGGKASLELVDLRGMKDYAVLQDHQVIKGKEEPLVQLVPKEEKVPKAILGSKVIKESLDITDKKVQRDLKALKVLMVLQDPKGQKGQLVPEGRQELKGQWDLKVIKDFKERLVLMDRVDSLAYKVIAAQRELRVAALLRTYLQCADMKKEMLKEIEKLRAEISVLKPTTFPPPTGPLGSITNPALSCKHIKDSNYHVRSGAYYVLTDTPGRKSRVYCHMENLGKCGGGGWTSVMKLDGNKKTFTYSSPLWSNKKEYQPYYGTSAFGRHETKLATYWSAPFNHVCVGMRTARYSIQFLRIRFRAKSLFDVIADGKYKKFHFGRDAWKGLVKDGSLQKHCNKEGFNIDIKFSHIVAARARIGIVSNQENDCWSCDSRIGFGMDGVLCGQDKSNSCGNEARCSPDNGDRSIKTLGYIFVQ